MSQTCYELCQEMISDCQVKSSEIIGPPLCSTDCDSGCSSDVCFSESTGAWTDGPICNNGTSICCCEEDCTDYHAEIISEYTGIDKDLVKYVLGGGAIAALLMLSKMKKAFTGNNPDTGGRKSSQCNVNICCGVKEPEHESEPEHVIEPHPEPHPEPQSEPQSVPEPEPEPQEGDEGKDDSEFEDTREEIMP